MVATGDHRVCNGGRARLVHPEQFAWLGGDPRRRHRRRRSWVHRVQRTSGRRQDCVGGRDGAVFLRDFRESPWKTNEISRRRAIAPTAGRLRQLWPIGQTWQARAATLQPGRLRQLEVTVHRSGVGLQPEGYDNGRNDNLDGIDETMFYGPAL